MTNEVRLSQAEIDALLNASASPSSSVVVEPVLTSDQKDALGEIGNMSFGSAATSLSALLQQRVEITTPSVTLLRAVDVYNEFPRPHVLVSVEFTAGLKGSNALAIELNDAKTIADLMLGGDGTNINDDLNELHLSAVGEAMNQMMGGAATAMSSIFGRATNISPPKISLVDLNSTEVPDFGTEGWLVNVSFRLRVGSLIDSKIMQLIPAPFAAEMVNLLKVSMEAMSQTTSTTQQVAAARVSPVPTISEQVGITIPADAPSQRPPISVVPQTSVPELKRPEFVDFATDNSTTNVAPRNLSLLYDVMLSVTVELGRTKRSIREILELSPGSVVELDKLAGEPVDIMVNHKRIAIGEVVVIDENFGVRVTEIIDPSERVKNLQ